ncbi:MAG: AMP-binding protein [Gammaproteobacteria bacterium]
MPTTLSIFLSTHLASTEQPFAIYQGQLLSRGQLWSDVRALASQLPDQPYQFNLCENRYLFCVCLLAAATRGQICLLPPSGQMAVVEEIQQDFPSAYLASDKPEIGRIDFFKVTAPNSLQVSQAPTFDWEKPIIVAFTSGSTGQPKPCAHSLNTFATSTQMAVDSLGLAKKRYLTISTTPPQHMYGLETSVFWPLFSELMLYDGRPFFPEDVRQAVASAPYPAILTTTPTHLGSLVKAEGKWHNLTSIISATDNLSPTLASETAVILGQSPNEIYGSTETLSFAYRLTQQDMAWHLYPGARLYHQNGQTWLDSPHLTSVLALQDRVDIKSDGRFFVLGRDADMIKIAGKRASLADLDRRLRAINGMDDGFFFLLKKGPSAGRMAAVVVSGLAGQAIRLALQGYLDEVFLPKKIYFVDTIPRNETGKLTRAIQEKLIAELTHSV